MSEGPTFGQGLEKSKDRRDTVGRGVATVLAWNFVHVIVGFAALDTRSGGIILAVFGAVELLYVIPLALVARAAGRREQMKGIIIGGSVGILLTAACWGLVFGITHNL